MRMVPDRARSCGAAFCLKGCASLTHSSMSFRRGENARECADRADTLSSWVGLPFASFTTRLSVFIYGIRASLLSDGGGGGGEYRVRPSKRCHDDPMRAYDAPTFSRMMTVQLWECFDLADDAAHLFPVVFPRECF